MVKPSWYISTLNPLLGQLYEGWSEASDGFDLRIQSGFGPRNRGELPFIGFHFMQWKWIWNGIQLGMKYFNTFGKAESAGQKISCWHRFDHSPHGQKREKAFHTVCNFMDITLFQNRMLFEMEVTMKQRRRNSIWQRWKMSVVSFSREGGCYRSAGKYWARFFPPIGHRTEENHSSYVWGGTFLAFVCWWSLGQMLFC